MTFGLQTTDKTLLRLREALLSGVAPLDGNSRSPRMSEEEKASRDKQWEAFERWRRLLAASYLHDKFSPDGEDEMPGSAKERMSLTVDGEVYIRKVTGSQAGSDAMEMIHSDVLRRWKEHILTVRDSERSDCQPVA